MYPQRYIQYLNFPRIPQEMLDKLCIDPNSYQRTISYESYQWSDEFNQEIDAWGKKNICENMYFAFQMMYADVPLHRDDGTLTKLNYVVNSGGSNVVTEFYNDNNELLDSYCIEPHRWHIFKADTLHCVKNIQPGQVRFSITARIFGK